MIFLSILCFILSGAAEAVMDKLQFHYHKSIFSDFKNQTFWNPLMSWKNKYKNNDPSMGEKFFGSKTIFVGLTDAWHLFKLIRNLFIFIGIFFISIGTNKILIVFIFVVIIRIMFGLSFTLFFKKILNK